MIANINQNITALTTFPNRTTYSSSSAYAASVVAWLIQEGIFSGQIQDLVPKLETMINEINTSAEAIAASELIVVGVSNYQGDWIAGTYSKSQSISIGDNKYISKIDNNTDEPPSSNWLLIKGSYSKTETYNQAEVDALLANNETSYATIVKYT